MGNRPSADIIYGFASMGGGCDDLIPYDPETFEPEYSEYGFGDDGWNNVYEQRTGKPVAESGCMIGLHGYSEEPGQFVGIRDTHVNGDWDGATKLNPSLFAVDPDIVEQRNQQLRDFCKMMNIVYQEPQWLLLCSYG